MRDLIDAFFRERSIVNHHIASFNDFLPTIDNPNSRMQRIVDNLRSAPEDERRGIIKLDEDRTEGDVIEIRIGRKRDDRGRIDLEAKPTITLGLPVVKEANGATHPLTPMEARQRNLNYTAPIYLDFTVIENGIEREPERVHIGNFPIMAKSKRCLLYKENMETEGELNQDEYRRKLIELGEDPFDPGGYFIIGGTERALISLEDLAPNRVLVEFNERYGRKVEVAKVFSQKEGYRALTLMEKKKDGQLIVSVPTASGQIPLIILMKALGMEKDEDIYNAIVSAPEMANIVYANIEECQNKKNYPPNGIFTRDDAINYLEKKFATGQAKEYRIKKVESILDRSLLPHLGDTREDRIKKAIFLGRVARTVLELSLGGRREDDKDHYANKRLKLAGDLMEDLFRVAFANLVKDLKYQLERSYARPGDGQLGRRSGRSEPAPGSHLEHERPESPSPRDVSAHPVAAALRGARPPPDAMGTAVPERDAGGSELRRARDSGLARQRGGHDDWRARANLAGSESDDGRLEAAEASAHRTPRAVYQDQAEPAHVPGHDARVRTVCPRDEGPPVLNAERSDRACKPQAGPASGGIPGRTDPIRNRASRNDRFGSRHCSSLAAGK